MNGPFSVKACLREEHRRFSFSKPDLEELRVQLRRSFGIPESTLFVVRYRDPDNDLISIGSNLELSEALRLNTELLRIQVELRTPAPAAPSMVPEWRNRAAFSSAVNKPTTVPVVSASTATATAIAPAGNGSMSVTIIKPAAAAPVLVSAPAPIHAEPEPASTLEEVEALRAKMERSKEELAQLKQRLQEVRQRFLDERQKFAIARKNLPKPSAKVDKHNPHHGMFNKDAAGNEQLARFVRDVSVPDGLEMQLGQRFVKCWRFRNESSHPWPAAVQLLFVGKNSDRLGAFDSMTVPAGAGLAPNAEIDVSVPLEAPQQPGRYTAYFRLADGAGKRFGQRVWASVQVVDDSSSSSSSSSDAEKPAPAVVEKAKKRFQPNDEELARYATQLRTLSAMGFERINRNVKLLRKFDGNLERVVAVLVRKTAHKAQHQHKHQHKHQ